jgi:hypothetical protein
VRRVALAQIGDQLAQGRERPGGRLINEVIGVHGGVALHASNQRIQPLAPGRVVQRVRPEQVVIEQPA